MNRHCHQVVFSERLGCLVAVGEHAKAQGKVASGQSTGTGAKSGSAIGFDFKNLVLCMALGMNGWCLAAPPAANTLPTNPTIVYGSASVNQPTGNALTITQSSQKAIITWDSFSIGSAASVSVTQANAQSVLLNRVTGSDLSQIYGKFSANGQVILINPNGMVFGAGSSVTATSFTASTFDLSNANFINDKLYFERNNSTAGIQIEKGASIQGNLTGGYIALVSAHIQNAGKITTQSGDIVMAGGESVEIQPNWALPLSPHVQLEITPAQIQTSITNTADSVLTTQGGQVLIQASSLVDLVSSAGAQVQLSGVINTQAPQAGNVTVTADNGRIWIDGQILADSGDAQATGAHILIGRGATLANQTTIEHATLSASKGFIETSGHQLTMSQNTLRASRWLVDPDDIQIVNTSSPASGTLSTQDIDAALNAGTMVSITTDLSANTGSGDIWVIDPILKSSGATAMLSLSAARNLYINNNISGSTGAALDVNLQAGNNILSTTSTGAVNSNGGWISINAGADITQNFAITSSGGPIQLYSSAGNISIQSNISSAGGGVYLTAETGNVQGSGNAAQDQSNSVNTAGGDIVVAAGNSISGGYTLNAATGNISFETYSNSPSAAFSGGLITQNTFIKSGSGSVILNGAATLTGNTWIQDGALQIGDGQSGLNPLANTASITIDPTGWLNLMPSAQGMTLAASISGLGSLAVTGTGGTVTLTGANNYQGVTTVADSTQNALVLQIGDGTNNTASLGTGVTYVGSGSTLSFLVKGDYTLNNVISASVNPARSASAGIVNANVTGALDIESSITVSQVNLQSTGVLTLNQAITTDSGMSLKSQTGIALNAALTNNNAGNSQSAIILQAGTGTSSAANSTAAITSGSNAQIVQYANGNVQLTTDGNGNLSVPYITNWGQGNVILGAGIQKLAGDGSQGQVLANQTQSVTQKGSGKTYVFTGDAQLSGALGNIDASLQNLYLSVVNGHNVNMLANHAFASSGLLSQTSVIFRNKVEFDTQLAASNTNVMYGQSTDSAALIAQAQSSIANDNATISQSNAAGTTWWSSTSYVSNITDLAYKNAVYSASGHLAVNSTGYQTLMTGQDFALTTTGVTFVTPLSVSVISISANNKVYDGSTTASISSGQLQGVLANDVVSVGATQANFADTTTGTHKTVTASGFYLTGADAGNYSIAPSSPAVLTTQANVVNSGSNAYPSTLYEHVNVLAQPDVRDATDMRTEGFQLASSESEELAPACHARNPQSCRCDELQGVQESFVCAPGD